VLHQVTRDQTVAQDLIDKGLLAAEQAKRSPFRHVLSSAIGSEERAPVVSRVDIRNRGVVLVCSDGLTKHVNDREIAERLATMESSEQVSRAFVDLALSRGGTDNITIVVGRARKLEESRAAGDAPGPRPA
jgi:protein phosphatase